MIYLMLENKKSHYQGLIVDFFKEQILDRIPHLEYSIVKNPKYIFESRIENIKDDDFIFWNSSLAYNNLDIVKRYRLSIVILEKPTVLVQKISIENPVNESMAINNGFFLTYIFPERDDITNKEWKLIVQEENYLLTPDKIRELILIIR